MKQQLCLTLLMVMGSFLQATLPCSLEGPFTSIMQEYNDRELLTLYSQNYSALKEQLHHEQRYLQSYVNENSEENCIPSLQAYQERVSYLKGIVSYLLSKEKVYKNVLFSLEPLSCISIQAIFGNLILKKNSSLALTHLGSELIGNATTFVAKSVGACLSKKLYKKTT